MRFLVVGTSGAGKSTFGQALAAALQCPFVELDEHYWGPHWTPVPHADFDAAVRAATSDDRWVADGNYSAVRDALWPRATHVVWLNYSRRVVFMRVLRRTLHRGLTRSKLSHGNRESLRTAFFSKDSILCWSYSTFRKNQHKYAALRRDPAYAHLEWTELNRPAQAKAFIAKQWRAPA